MSAPTVTPAIKISEAEFTAQVLSLAKIFRWRSAHFRPAQTARGWRTPVQGDGKGWLDLTLIRPPRIVVAELKVGRGKLTPEQMEWIEARQGCPGVDVFIWYPADFKEIAAVLR